MKHLLTALVLSALTLVGTSVDAQPATPNGATVQSVEVDDRANTNDPLREAVGNLTYSYRVSTWFDYKSWVLVLHNPSRRSVDITVRCFTRNGNSTDIRVSILAGSSAEIGWVQGWDGNFVEGEHALVIYGGQTIGRIAGPTDGKY